MLLVVKISITPTKRSDIEEIIEVAPSDIEAVRSFDKGVIEVQYGNGSVEIRSGGSISWRYNNPGNIKFGKFAKETGAVGPGDGNHAVYPNLTKGEDAMKHLIFSDARGFNTKTILEMLKVYAPAEDGNNPNSYAKFVASRMGVSVNTKINTLSPRQKADMIEAMKTAEGFKIGTVQRIQ
jgi:hypothetical protein